MNACQVKDSFRKRALLGQPGLRYRLLRAWDGAQGWVAVAAIGVLTACVAFCVDVAEATVSDWKEGYCARNPFLNREGCCTGEGPGAAAALSDGIGAQKVELGAQCAEWTNWSELYAPAFGIYVGFALLFGLVAGCVTMLTKSTLTAAEPTESLSGSAKKPADPLREGKTIYLAAGSGIPEIKTILAGFVIPHILDVKVLVVKAVGATFAVATGMCLGKEGPFVHISTCVAYQVGMLFPKYRENSRKMRELLSAGCASGLSVAFGAPIGGVLFSYEEISTYFPRKVLWRAFLCSLTAAVVLRELNPTGTGKLVLFETNYGTTYRPIHYLFFVILGLAGGLFGGVFCKANFLWSKSFRKYAIIKNHPVLEVFLVVLVTALVQYPNPLTRDAGDTTIKKLLVDCRKPSESWVCRQEASADKGAYVGWLVYGTLVKLLLTTITFGAKVPSGIIIPSLDAGAFFGRLLGQLLPHISPGVFAMVGAAAFLAGVSRMTISLCVIMFELTGELEYIVPHMIAILVAKWVADALEREGVYDLAQTVLGHPFLDTDHALSIAQASGALTAALIPPPQTMDEITVHVDRDGFAPRALLKAKLAQLRRRGLEDAGLVLVGAGGLLRGYLAEGELDFGLAELGQIAPDAPDARVALLTEPLLDDELDLSPFVDRTPLTLCASAPVEYATEMFGKLGLRYLCVVEEGSGRLLGVSPSGDAKAERNGKVCRLLTREPGHHQEAAGELAGAAEALRVHLYLCDVRSENLCEFSWRTVPGLATPKISVVLALEFFPTGEFLLLCDGIGCLQPLFSSLLFFPSWATHRSFCWSLPYGQWSPYARMRPSRLRMGAPWRRLPGLRLRHQAPYQPSWCVQQGAERPRVRQMRKTLELRGTMLGLSCLPAASRLQAYPSS